MQQLRGRLEGLEECRFSLFRGVSAWAAAFIFDEFRFEGESRWAGKTPIHDYAAALRLGRGRCHRSITGSVMARFITAKMIAA